MGLVESGGKSSNITENSRDKEDRTSLINLEFARIEGSRLCLIVYVGKLQHSLQEEHFSGRDAICQEQVPPSFSCCKFSMLFLEFCACEKQGTAKQVFVDISNVDLCKIPF